MINLIKTKIKNPVVQYIVLCVIIGIICIVVLEVGFRLMKHRDNYFVKERKTTQEFMVKYKCVRTGFIPAGEDEIGPTGIYSCNNGQPLLYSEIENIAQAMAVDLK